jgi:hypothetical protein
MSNRLTKTDFIVVYMILFSISFFIVGFFLGANIGKSKMEEEFAKYLDKNDEVETDDSKALKYSHTDFVSYYYDVYLPFKEFRKSYLNFYHQVSTQNIDQLAATTEMRKSLKEIKTQLSEVSVPDSSPLLQQSHQEYLSALLAFESGLQKLLASESERAKQFQKLIVELDEFEKGEKHWLHGQSLFYEAVILWESFYVTKEAPVLLEKPLHFTLNQWKDLSFHKKNELIAKTIEEQNILGYFNPEDVLVYLETLTAHDDQAHQLHNVSEAIKFLVASGSIRAGEFVERIDRFEAVSSPTIPLYSK